MTAAIAALLSILGVVVGAVVQHLLAKQTNHQKQLLEARNEAYVDFLEAVSLVIAAQRAGKREQEVEQLAKLAHAKTRICIFGQESVVRKLAEFWATGAVLQTESQLLSFTRFCLDIRQSLGLKDKTSLNAEVAELLFRVRPPSA